MGDLETDRSQFLPRHVRRRVGRGAQCLGAEEEKVIVVLIRLPVREAFRVFDDSCGVPREDADLPQRPPPQAPHLDVDVARSRCLQCGTEVLNRARGVSRPLDACGPRLRFPVLLRWQPFAQAPRGVFYVDGVAGLDGLREESAPHRERLLVTPRIIQRGRRAVAQVLTDVVEAKVLDLVREFDEHVGRTLRNGLGQLAGEPLALWAVAHKRDGFVVERRAPVHRDRADGLPT